MLVNSLPVIALILETSTTQELMSAASAAGGEAPDAFQRDSADAGLAIDSNASAVEAKPDMEVDVIIYDFINVHQIRLEMQTLTTTTNSIDVTRPLAEMRFPFRLNDSMQANASRSDGVGANDGKGLNSWAYEVCHYCHYYWLASAHTLFPQHSYFCTIRIFNLLFLLNA